MMQRGTGRRRPDAARWRGVAVLLVAVALGGQPVAASGQADATETSAPSPLFRVWIGMEDQALGLQPLPGAGLALGLRVHPRAAITVEGYLAARTQVQGWYALGGVRLSPLLRPEVRLDVDLRAGPGNHGWWAKGAYWIDGEALRTYLMLRADGTLLGSVDRRAGMGPRLRIETQPVFVARRGTMEDGSTETEPRLAFRSHQVLSGLAWEVDLGRGHHLGLDLLIGISVWGDHSRVMPTGHAALGWSFDPRPARSAAITAEGS